MLKLMKYEFRKSASSKLILLVHYCSLSELVYLLGDIFLKKDVFLMGTGMMFLVSVCNYGVSCTSAWKAYHDSAPGSEQQTKLYAVSDTKEQL